MLINEDNLKEDGWVREKIFDDEDLFWWTKTEDRGSGRIFYLELRPTGCYYDSIPTWFLHVDDCDHDTCATLANIYELNKVDELVNLCM